MARLLAAVFLLALVVHCTSSPSLPTADARHQPYSSIQRQVSRRVRATKEERSTLHDHEGASENTSAAGCTVDRKQLLLAFNEVAQELNVTGVDGSICSLPVVECHHHDNDDDDEEDHHDNDDDVEDHHDNRKREHIDDYHGSGGGSGGDSTADSWCLSVYEVCSELLLHTNLVTPACLSGECVEEEDSDNTTSSSSGSRPGSAKAYGYGFLMVLLVSLGSLLGIVVVPLISNGNGSSHNRGNSLTRKALVYKYTYFFMIALGTSALICDAVLHLFPHVWELHAHGAEGEMAVEGEDLHAHEGEDGHGKGVEEFLWKGSIALLAIYLFYLLEFLLHSFTSHTHSHGFPTDTSTECKENGRECIQLDATLPHGQCDHEGTSSNAHILHPGPPGPGNTSVSSEQSTGSFKDSLVKSNSEQDTLPKKRDVGSGRRNRALRWLRRIKPLAWLIIVGDGLHNFADGLALGAAISQSLALGISTTIALVFHEIPHEFGDYVILISTGLSWYTALLFNFISALTAMIGFFVGVAIGTASEEVNGWVLAFAAGLFIYIALVDLLPELVHTKERGRHRWGLFLAANSGFFISYVVLFLVAVYEEDLNNLVSD